MSKSLIERGDIVQWKHYAGSFVIVGVVIQKTQSLGGVWYLDVLCGGNGQIGYAGNVKERKVKKIGRLTTEEMLTHESGQIREIGVREACLKSEI